MNMGLKQLSLMMVGAASLVLSGNFAWAELKVVTSIKPVHSLVSSIMEGVGEPFLIVDGVSSPHDFALKPSQATALQDADIVFWIGDGLETFLVKPVGSIAENAVSVELMETKNLVLYPYRKKHEDHDEDGDHKNHDKAESHEHHDKDDHKDHADEGHDHKDEDGHKDHAENEGHEGHAHHYDGNDAHIWLSPENAKLMSLKIRDVLKQADPENSEKYDKNYDKLSADLGMLEAELIQQMKHVQNKPYIVFHDAYQYFEKTVGIERSAVVRFSSEIEPGPAQIQKLRDRVKDKQIVCIFSEPQFSTKMINTVREGSGVSVATLDPLGSELTNGPELYGQLMRNMGNAFKSCLNQ